MNLRGVPLTLYTCGLHPPKKDLSQHDAQKAAEKRSLLAKIITLWKTDISISCRPPTSCRKKSKVHPPIKPVLYSLCCGISSKDNHVKMKTVQKLPRGRVKAQHQLLKVSRQWHLDKNNARYFPHGRLERIITHNTESRNISQQNQRRQKTHYMSSLYCATPQHTPFISLLPPEFITHHSLFLCL